MVSRKIFIGALICLLSFTVIANTKADYLVSEVEKEKTSHVLDLDKLNDIFSPYYSALTENNTPQQYSEQQRQFNISALAKTLVRFYGLDEQHEFRLFNIGSQYSRYYILQHYYNNKAVYNEIVTIALDENNSIIKFSGGVQVSVKSSVSTIGVKTRSITVPSSQSIISWLKNNSQSPFSKYSLTINSIVEITYINNNEQYIPAYKVDVFHVGNNGQPYRALLVIDPISKEIYQQSNLLKLNGEGESSITKNLHSKGGNFFKGEREYKAPYAPKVTDCKLLTYVEEFYLNKRLLVTVDMNNLTALDQWDAYALTQEDCENESIFYEEDQLGFTYAYAPLADAHFHAELVMEMYNVYLQEAILGVCTVNNTHPNCTQYYKGNGVNNDVPIYQGVHYDTSYLGAFWSGSAAYYGDGAFSALPNVSLDTIAHELTHGYQQFDSNALYIGALDEAISDIAGEAAKEFVFNKTRNTDHSYFKDDSYTNDYRYKYGWEIMREEESVVRSLLFPNVTSIPENAGEIPEHALSGPISLVFATLVNEGKLKNFKDAFKILANSKKTCVNTSIIGYIGLNLAANCIVDLADGMEHSGAIDTVNIKNELSTAFRGINLNIE